MSIRNQILTLAEACEQRHETRDTSHALYLLASSIDDDGRHCTFFDSNVGHGPTRAQLTDIGRGVGMMLAMRAKQSEDAKRMVDFVVDCLDDTAKNGEVSNVDLR